MNDIKKLRSMRTIRRECKTLLLASLHEVQSRDKDEINAKFLLPNELEFNKQCNTLD